MTNDRHDHLLSELKNLNDTVTAAVEARTSWMDAHMSEFSKFQVGDTVYGEQGQVLGVVTRLYRFHAGHDWRYDTDMSVDATFEMRGLSNCFDNTSCQPFCCFTCEEIKARLQNRLATLR